MIKLEKFQPSPFQKSKLSPAFEITIPNGIREKFNLIRNLIEGWLRSYIFWILLAIIIGGLFSFLVFRTYIAKPEIGTIRISGVIFSQWDADQILEMLRYAKEKKEIKVVLLVIDSPGGEASVIEEIYFATLKLREKKPIVASINQKGASGGYYIAIASNYIFAKPDSEVGSIGAWTILPWPETISEEVLPTGPFKDTGMSRRKAVGQLEMLRQSFLKAVLFHRQGKLKISPEELTRAEVYVGLEGLKYGLIDEIGSGFEAIEKAAKLAGLSHYKVVDIREELVKQRAKTTEGFVTQPTTESPSLLPRYYYLIESIK